MCIYWYFLLVTLYKSFSSTYISIPRIIIYGLTSGEKSAFATARVWPPTAKTSTGTGKRTSDSRYSGR